MLYILCPAGGMRIGEVLALDIDMHISADCRVIKVRGQVKGSRIVSYLKSQVRRVVQFRLAHGVVRSIHRVNGNGDSQMPNLREAVVQSSGRAGLLHFLAICTGNRVCRTCIERPTT